MDFFHQYLPLLMLLEKGRLTCFTIVFMYALNTKSWSLCFRHFILFILSWDRFSPFYICRMELGTLSKGVSLLSETLEMFVIILTSQFWMTCDKGPQMWNIMKSGLLFVFLKMIWSLIQLISILSSISCPGNPSQQKNNMVV